MKPWATSTRRARLPKNWAKLRRLILTRASGQCEWTDELGRCQATATDIDHKTPGDNHHPSNLQALCTWHHSLKSKAERATAHRAITNRHPAEPHPGLKKARGRG